MVAQNQALYCHVCDEYRKNGVFDIPMDAGHTSEALLQALAKCPLMYRPGEAMTYGLGVDVLGLIIERLTHKTLEEFATQRLFVPLSMTDSHWTLPASKLARLAPLASQNASDGKLTVVVPGEMKDINHFRFEAEYTWTHAELHRSGGAGMVSTIDDYATFLRFVMATSKGITAELGMPRFLSRTAAQLMCEDSLGSIPLNRRDFMVEGTTFGLGFQVIEKPGLAGIMASPGSCRWAGIFGSEYFFDPKEEVGAVTVIQCLWADEDASKR